MLNPKRTFAAKIALTFTAVFLAVALPSAYFVDRALQKSARTSLQESLRGQARILAESLAFQTAPAEGPELQAFLESISGGLRARVTVIDPSGKVLADSSKRWEQ